jgi:hypothetical protein
MALRNTTLYLATDTHIREDNPNTNYGALTSVVVGERFLGAVWVEHRGVLRINWTSIPKLGEIQAAVLHLPLVTPPTVSMTLRAYAISHQTQFTETGVTWNRFNGLGLWNTAGILESGQAPIAEDTVLNADGEATLDVTMALYDWHKGRIEDQGFLLVGIATQEWLEFAARTEGTPPYVEVTYLHHETVSQAGRERWWATVYDPAENVVYDNYLEVAPAEINVTQELPTEDVLLTSRGNTFITPYKGTEADFYSTPFDTGQLDDFLIERSSISRQLELGWGVVKQSYANLWQQWMEFGCTIYLYPGRRYDPLHLRQAYVGVEGRNLWTEWPWVDPVQNFRLWQEGVEIYNSAFPGSWIQEDDGGRISKGVLDSPVQEYEYLCRFRWKVRPIDVTPAYHATHRDNSCAEVKISSLQVTCLELDWALDV